MKLVFEDRQGREVVACETIDPKVDISVIELPESMGMEQVLGISDVITNCIKNESKVLILYPGVRIYNIKPGESDYDDLKELFQKKPKENKDGKRIES